MSDTVGPLALAQASVRALRMHKTLPPGRILAADEHATLAGWSGWGPLADAVDRYVKHRLTGGWKDVVDELSELLSPQEEETAKECTATAFYTTPHIAGAMWNLMERLGFPGGRVLEPGCGSGNFMAATPAGLDVDWTGVEIDPTSAGIAARLNPAATIINKPLERTAFRIGAFDAAIGNVPFAKEAVYDATWDKDAAGFEPALHRYFIWRALKALHPGGIACLITSRYTMDSENSIARAYFSRLAEFVGAIRLPSGAFGQLGFKGVADILVLRRRPYDAYDTEDVEVGAWATSRKHAHLLTTVNDYWWHNPDMCLGSMYPRGGQAHGATLDVLPPDGADLADLLARAVDKLVVHATMNGRTWQGGTFDDDAEVVVSDDKEGSFHLGDDGAVTQVLNGNHEPVAKASDELKNLILLRDAATDLFAADADLERADADIAPLREHARRLYEQYVDRYGPLNRCTITYGEVDEDSGLPAINRRTPSLGGFRGVGDRPGDPDFPTVLALGVWDDDTNTETPAQILTQRVNRRPERKSSADNPAEALALCWDELGRLDLARIAALLGIEESEVPDQIAGLAFLDPAEDRWVPAEEYLSGNVREKLQTVEGMVENGDDPDRADRWRSNLGALSGVQPVDLGPSDIIARLGAPWIPTDVIRLFICHLFELTIGGYSDESAKVAVRHEKLTASWEVSAPPARQRPAATTRWGTDRFNGVDLIEKALNGTAPVAWDEIEVPDPDRPGKYKTKRVKNQQDTQLAEERTKQIQEEFGTWVWTDPKRSERLCHLYNWTYNAVRLRKYDGGMFTFPGLRAGFTPYEHQKAMVARIVASPATICAHSVGAGKTATMIMSGMTMKRLGMINKPCAVVPNHLLEQVAAEFRRLYPTARILMVTKADLNPKRRKFFAAKVAAADWDMIVMTVQQFTSIPVSPDLEAAFIADQIAAIEEAMGADDELDGSRTVKRLAKLVMKLRQRHAALTSFGGQQPEKFPGEATGVLDAEAAEIRSTRKRKGRDDGLYFDHLGIDFLMIDEFHYFKNLFSACRTDGFSMPASKRAEDAFMKITWLRNNSPTGRCFAGFTGTPISNTLAEAYTLLRYACSTAWLAEKDLASFDAFAGMFIMFESKIEVSPDGAGFRMHRRPSKFLNVPELRLMLGESMDVRTRHQLKLDGPSRVVREVVKVEGQSELKPFIQDLVTRADQIRQGKPMPRYSAAKNGMVEDNMLLICNDGRKAALWLPLVDLESDEQGKPEAVAANVARIYHHTKNWTWPDPAGGLLFGDTKPGGCQFIFCDLGTPREGDNQVYGYTRELLVEYGVPRHMIRFVHDAKTDLERAFLFKQCRDGDVAVLFVSTEKGGTGVNAQDRLVAIHHMDAPWRPADVEQRDGRGDRPGNLSHILWIFRYVTEGSFDSYMWQHLERKSYFIFQILSGELDVRQVDDIVSDDTLDYANIKAAATGQELVLELARAQAEVARLRNLYTAHQRDMTRLRADQRYYTQSSYTHAERGKAWQEIAGTAADSERVFDKYSRTIVAEEDVAMAMAEAGRYARANRHENEAGQWRGVRVKFSVAWDGGRPHLTIMLAVRSGWKWTPIPDAKPALLTKGNERNLLRFIDRAIDRAEREARIELDYSEKLKARADAIIPELNKTFDFEEELNRAVAERDRIEGLIEADLNVPAEMAQAA